MNLTLEFICQRCSVLTPPFSCDSKEFTWPRGTQRENETIHPQIDTTLGSVRVPNSYFSLNSLLTNAGSVLCWRANRRFNLNCLKLIAEFSRIHKNQHQECPTEICGSPSGVDSLKKGSDGSAHLFKQGDTKFSLSKHIILSRKPKFFARGTGHNGSRAHPQHETEILPVSLLWPVGKETQRLMGSQSHTNKIQFPEFVFLLLCFFAIS